MGYHVSFTGEVPQNMSQGGSERCLFCGGKPELMRPDWNMTYNYSDAFTRAFENVEILPEQASRKGYNDSPCDYGLWRMCGKTPRKQIADLESAVDKLSPLDETDNYWDGTDGNARKVLKQMLDISIWWLAHHPELADQTEEGVWYRNAW